MVIKKFYERDGAINRQKRKTLSTLDMSPGKLLQGIQKNQIQMGINKKKKEKRRVWVNKVCWSVQQLRRETNERIWQLRENTYKVKSIC